MSENKRPVNRTARPTAGTGTKTGTRTGARPASASARTGASNKARTPSNPNKRPLPRRSAPRRKTVGGVDLETVITLLVILAVLAGVIVLMVLGIKNCSSRNTTKIDYDVANIRPAVTDVPAADTTSAPDGTIASAAVTAPTATPVASVIGGRNLRTATIRTVGDFVIDVGLIDAAKSYATLSGSKYPYDFHNMLSMISETMQNADFTVANVDGSMGGKSHYKYGYSGYPQFNTPEYLLDSLVDAGVDLLTLANNHMLDGWFDGLMDEIENVEKAGIKHVGANRSLAEKNTPVICEINGIRVGFMNYTVSLNDMENRGVDKKALEFGVNAVRNSDAAADAKLLREAGADVIVCYMHWGTEYYSTPDNDQKNLANKLVKAGVDVIMGGHPHVVQHAEWMSNTNQFGEMQRTLCVYSVGNFLSNHKVVKNKAGQSVNCDGGVIFDFTIQEKGDGSFEITAPAYLPVYVWTTGDSIRGYDYKIVPCGRFIVNKSRPVGMSDADYTAMQASYNFQVNVMSEGVGTLIMQ